MTTMPNYKKNFTLNSSLKIEKEKKLLANIGLIIKKIRIQRGITRDILAIKSKISLRYLAKLESGNGNPTISVLKNIAYALNITFKELMFTENSDNKKNLVKNKIDQYNNVQLKEILLFLNKFDKEQPKKINKNKIALIGLRGAGKTTLGSMFSEEFNMPLYEITNEIEKESGMKVNEIMELGGQSMYRRLEYNAIFNLSKKNKKLIILTGGSMVSEKQTFDFVLNNFFTIWIKATPKEHMERVIKQGDLRPMASNPKAMDDLNNILKERKNLYSQADVILNTKDKDPVTSYKDFKYLIKN